MIIDDARIREIVRYVYGGRQPTLTAEEARAVVGIMYLAVEIDLDEDSEELAVLQALNGGVCALAGISPVASPPLPRIPIDEEERAAVVAALISRLTSKASRELAYTLASLVVVSDLNLAPIESTFLEELRAALEIPEERAADLAATAAEIVTPLDEPDESQPTARQ